LQDKVTQLSTDFDRLVGEVSALRSTAAGIQTLSEQVSALKTQIAGMSPIVTPSQLRPPPSPAPSRPSAQQPPVPSFDSWIISGFPEIFAEFRKNQISLLWRGSRDGFKATEFHRRCDGHANTLTVILDTKRNIFGGFTPVKWESKDGWNPDNSLKSFLFTLKNPHSIPARRFALNPEKKDWAIMCYSNHGPSFGYDVGVSDNCSANTNNWIYLGNNYINDTGREARLVFTGSEHFQVKEIEVFEITA
jgi:hypothetical protein